ncbi:MAG: hypothetical protein ACD_64C00337G0002 [uncultured bacterium]|nr:MAG: hypothetical protein ACD_64C00337G0002 [uncultured bacterium]
MNGYKNILFNTNSNKYEEVKTRVLAIEWRDFENNVRVVDPYLYFSYTKILTDCESETEIVMILELKYVYKTNNSI